MNHRALRHFAVLLSASLLMSACTQKDPATHVAAAKAALAKKDTKTATIEAKNALQLNVDLADARFVLGSALLKENNANGAELELRKAQAAGYPAAEVAPLLARALLLQQQAKKLIAEFGKTRLDVPAAQALVLAHVALAHEMLGDFKASEAALAEALASDPKCVTALLTQARQLARSRDLDGARTKVDAVLAVHADDADAWKLKGDLEQVAGKNTEALAAYNKALDNDAGNFAAHTAAVMLHLRQGRLDDAGKQLERFKAARPSLMVKYLEAQLAYAKRDFKGARDAAQALLKSSPNNAQFLQIAGASELQLNSMIQAEIYLSRALQIEPDLPLARRLLAVTHLRSGQPAKAMTGLNTMTGGGKQEIPPELYALAGEIYLQNGDPTKAESYFSRALKLDPNSSEKRTALAMSRLARGENAEAFDELESTAKSDQGAVADLALISALLRKGDHARAIAAIERLEAKEPKNPRAAIMRGRIQLAMKDPAAARKSFERALAIEPGSMAATSNLAALDLAQKKPEEAKARFEQLLAKNPQNVQAMLALAQLAGDDPSKKDQVTAWLNKSVEADPADGDARRALVNHLLKTGDVKLALETAQKAVSAQPNSADALDTLGRAQQAAGEFNQAIATFAKFSTAQPLSPLPHLRLASAHMAAKNPDAAEQSLRKALELKPDLLEAQNALMNLLVNGRKYPQALDIARAIQKQRPEAALGYLAEGDILAAQGKHDASAVAYRNGLQQAARPELAIKLHAALTQAGKAADANRFASGWQKDHPNDALFLRHLGDTALSAKDMKLAERLYRDSLTAEPNNPVTLNNLAWVVGQLGQSSEAITLAEKANQLAPRQPAFLDTWAMLLAARNETGKAAELLNQALATYPKNQLLRLNLAKVYLQAGDKPKARKELESVLSGEPSFNGRQEAETLLKSL